MTRCASPNGAVEFCYDFPVASTSRAASPTAMAHTTRPRSPRRRPAPSPARWARDDESDDELDFDEESMARRYATLPVPITPTGNQWTVAKPHPHLTVTTPHSALYPPSYGMGMGLPSSYESERSVLSSFSASAPRPTPTSSHTHNKIRKPRRRSVDYEPSSLSPPPPLSYTTSSSSSAPSSPYSLPRDDFSDMEPEFEEEPVVVPADADAEEQGQGQELDDSAHAETCDPSMTLRKQWAALSLRVRFGVFRAKRRMRDRVGSL